MYEDKSSKKHQELEQLQQQWYSKLKQNGFVDIENCNHPDRPLTSWHAFKWATVPHDKKEQIESYFYKARTLLHTYEFESETHKIIWELHSEGLSKRQIERQLIILKCENPVKREQIGKIINFIALDIL